MTFHKNLTEIHKLDTFTFADTPARWAGTDYTLTALDVGKVCRQTDDGSLWVLVNHSPIFWEPMTLCDHRVRFIEEFMGDALLNIWVTTVSGTGSDIAVRGQPGGTVRLRAGAELAASAELDFGNAEQIEVALNPEYTVRVKADEITDAIQIVGLVENNGGTEGIFIRRTAAGNWFAVCEAASTETTVDIGAPSTDYFELKLLISSASVLFYMDEVLVATITTNIPTEDLQPFFYIENEAAVEVKDVFIDSVTLDMSRGTL